MKFLTIVLVLFACGSSNTNSVAQDQKPEKMPDLEQSIWRKKVVEGVYNYYEFTSDIDFKYYSAELEDMFYGDYEVKNDTLYTFVKTSARDSLLDANSPHRSLKTRKKFIMTDGKLLLVHNEYKHARGWITVKMSRKSFYIKKE